MGTMTVEDCAKRIDESYTEDAAPDDEHRRRGIAFHLRELLAAQPVPASCAHEWVPATVAVLAEAGVKVHEVPDGGQWCGRCKSLRRPPRDAALPAGLTPPEKVTHIVARELSFALGTPDFVGVSMVEVVQGLLLVAADIYVSKVGGTPKERADGWASLSRDILQLALEQARTTKGGLQLVR